MKEVATIKRVIRGKVEEIVLTYDEINAIIECNEKRNILEDILEILHRNYDVDTKFDEDIQKDIDIIYGTFIKVSDSDLSHWENIEKTIDYLKDCYNTVFHYSSI